jgi:hypothetical protein
MNSWEGLAGNDRFFQDSAVPNKELRLRQGTWFLSPVILSAKSDGAESAAPWP